jgi:hypothetical protein
VRELQVTMDSREFAEWMSFARLEPIGERRGDWQAASIVAAIANANRDPKKRKEAFAVSDFLLRFGTAEEEPERQTWQEQLRIAEMLNVAFGGVDLREGAHDQG